MKPPISKAQEKKNAQGPSMADQIKKSGHEHAQASSEATITPALAHNVFKSNLVDPLLS